MSQTETEILEISHLAIHRHYLVYEVGANGEISQNAMTLINSKVYICVKKIDLNDNWVEMEISIMARGLPNDKYVLDEE